jgi:hypothetical protein
VKLPGLFVFAYLAIVDGKLFAKLQVFGVHDGFIVQSAEHDLPLLVTVMNPDPHPFAGKALNLAVEFDLDVVSLIKPGHVAPLPSYCR